MAKEEIKT